MKLWQLPPQLDDLRPPQAWQFELMRRRFLDALDEQGYAYIHPPIIEYSAALKSTNPNINLCLVSDGNNEEIAIRADMTAQSARVDANLKQHKIAKYFYAGEVLHRPNAQLRTQRNPYQIGAEIFGDDTLTADLECLTIALQLCEIATLTNLTLDIGHTGILKNQLQALSDEQKTRVIDILKRRSHPDLEAYLQKIEQPQLLHLLRLNGDDLTVITEQLTSPSAQPQIQPLLKQTAQIHTQLSQQFPAIRFHFDFSETQSWEMYSGLNWRLYSNNQIVARGGRYDGIGEPFGHARPANGFSFELNRVMACL